MNYQMHIWKYALSIGFELQRPLGYDWGDKDGKLEVIWIEQKPTSESMLKLITCNYYWSVCGKNGQCRILSIECTDLCKCVVNSENVQYCMVIKTKKERTTRPVIKTKNSEEWNVNGGHDDADNGESPN